MVLSLDNCDVSPGSPPSLASLVSSRSVLQGPTPPRDWAYLPAGYHSSASSAPVPAFTSSSTTSTTTSASNSASPHHPAHPKHGSKPNSLGVSSGVEKKNNSPGHAGKSAASQQPHAPGSPSNGTALSSAALEGTWTAGHLSRANGVTLYPYQVGACSFHFGVWEHPTSLLYRLVDLPSFGQTFFVSLMDFIQFIHVCRRRRETPRHVGRTPNAIDCNFIVNRVLMKPTTTNHNITQFSC